MRIPAKPKAGAKVYGECKYCPAGQNVFVYIFYRKRRTVCDRCLSSGKRNRDNSSARKRYHETKPKRGDQTYQDRSQLTQVQHALMPTESRAWTGSKLLHLPADKAARAIDRILNGKDTYAG